MSPIPRTPGRSASILTGGIGCRRSVAFSPDGHTLASGDSDGTVRLWDVADPAHPRLLGPILTGSGHVPSIRWRSAPMGARWPAATVDGTVRLWDVADPAHPRSLGRP